MSFLLYRYWVLRDVPRMDQLFLMMLGKSGQVGWYLVTRMDMGLSWGLVGVVVGWEWGVVWFSGVGVCVVSGVLGWGCVVGIVLCVLVWGWVCVVVVVWFVCVGGYGWGRGCWFWLLGCCLFLRV